MAGDQRLSLLARAAAQGRIDFRQARLLDAGWWRRLNLVLAELHREAEAEALDMSLRFQLALVANGSLTDESFQDAKRSAWDVYLGRNRLLRPWLATEAERAKERVMADARELFRRHIGDPDDPAFVARMEGEARRLRQMGIESARREAREAAEFERRLAERNARGGRR